MYIDSETRNYYQNHATFYGGESFIYKKGNLLYKIFDENLIQSTYRKERMIPLIQKENLRDVGQIPYDILEDENKNVIGVLLPYIEGIRMGKYLKKMNDVEIFLKLSKLLERFHKEQVSLIDVNLNNFIVTPKRNLVAIDLTSVYINNYQSNVCSDMILDFYDNSYLYLEYFANYIDKVSLYLLYLNYITRKEFHKYKGDIYFDKIEQLNLNNDLLKIYIEIRETLLCSSDVPYLHEIMSKEALEEQKTRILRL